MKAVILAGGQDTGRCPLSIIRPRPLFPIPERVLLHPLLKALKAVDVEEAIICANGKTHVLREHFENTADNAFLELGFHDDHYPRGTAGCIADLAGQLRDDKFLVIEGGLFIDGGMPELLDRHARAGAALTVAAVPVQHWYAGNGNTGSNGGSLGPLGIYVIEPDVLDFIPAESYCDIKEQLLPKLAVNGLPAAPVKFTGKHRRVNNAGRYTMLVHEMLYQAMKDGVSEQMAQLRHGVWVDPTAYVAESATLIGPVIVGANSVVGDNVVVTGPSLIGEHVKIDDDATITSSIIWPNASIGLGARIVDSIVTDGFHASVFSQLADSIAIDKRLNAGDLHGLHSGGYQVGRLKQSSGHRQGGMLKSVGRAIRSIFS